MIIRVTKDEAMKVPETYKSFTIVVSLGPYVPVIHPNKLLP